MIKKKFLKGYSSFHLANSLSSASLASSLSDDFLAKATVEVVRNLGNKSSKAEMTRTNIQMIGALRWAT